MKTQTNNKQNRKAERKAERKAQREAERNSRRKSERKAPNPDHATCPCFGVQFKLPTVIAQVVFAALILRHVPRANADPVGYAFSVHLPSSVSFFHPPTPSPVPAPVPAHIPDALIWHHWLVQFWTGYLLKVPYVSGRGAKCLGSPTRTFAHFPCGSLATGSKGGMWNFLLSRIVHGLTDCARRVGED